MFDTDGVRQRAEWRYLTDPEFCYRVKLAVQITEQKITNGDLFTAADRDVATSAAATALILADIPAAVLSAS